MSADCAACVSSLASLFPLRSRFPLFSSAIPNLLQSQKRAMKTHRVIRAESHLRSFLSALICRLTSGRSVARF